MVFDYTDKSFGIPIINIENMESYHPVDSAFRGLSFDITLDEAYPLMELNNGGIVVAERNGAGGTFFTKNLIKGLQERRKRSDLKAYTFIKIDTNVYEMCARKNITLSQYIDSLHKTINDSVEDKIDYDNIVLVTDHPYVGDKIAELAPSFGYKTIIDMHEGAFSQVFKDRNTAFIAKRLASGWGVFTNAFNEVEDELIPRIVFEMVKYDNRKKGLKNGVDLDFISHKMDLFDEAIQANENRLNIYKALSRVDSLGDFSLPPSFYAKFIEIYIKLEETATSIKYVKKSELGQDDYDKALLSETIDFFTTWTIALESNDMINAIDQAVGQQPQSIEISEQEFEELIKNGMESLSNLIEDDGKSKDQEDKNTNVLEFKDLDVVNANIKKDVIGQDNIVDTITQSFSLPVAGLRDETKPVRSIIAAGSTGVGKALHKDTIIPTPQGYKTVETLTKGDTIYAGDGKTCKIVEKYNPLAKDQYILSFSNTESIVACGDHLWTVITREGKKETLDTRTLYYNKTQYKEKFHIIAPHSIYDSPEAEETIEKITQELNVNIHDYTNEHIDNLITMINDEIIAYPNDSNVDLLPAFINLMPLEERIKYVAKIIDNVDNVFIEQSKKCTYVVFDIDSHYHCNLVKLFSSVGCISGVDRLVHDGNVNEIHFTINSDVASVSHKVSSMDFTVKNYESCKYVEITDIERAPSDVFSKHDFYCFTVDSDDALFLCGESHIPTHNTKLAYSLAKNLYTQPVELIRFDMSEFKHSHDILKFIGSAPGYQNANNGGTLTNAAMDHPHAIILIDELEKADADIADVFLQILDAGRLTDGLGRTADFTNNVFVFTTNLGVEERKKNNLGFKTDSNVKNGALDNTHTALKKFFKPEFLARIDDVMVFNDIDDSAGLIVKQEINILKDKMKLSGHTIKRIPPTIIKHVLEKSDFKTFGARDIQKIVRKEIGEKVALEIIKNAKNKSEENELKNISLTVKNGNIVATIKQ